MKFIIITTLILSFNFAFSITTYDIKTMKNADKKLMKKVGIKIKEKFVERRIDMSITPEKLFKQGVDLLEKKHDIFNAHKIFSYLNLNSKNDKYRFYLAKCYYFIGEFYYKGYIRKYYQKAYDILEKLSDKHENNKMYKRWHSFAAAKVGSFIKHKEKGTFSGLSFLRESVSVNDDILDDIDSKDEEALLTEGEYQIETDSVPIFGGNIETGIKIYKKTLRRYPNSLRGHILFGKYYYKEAKKYEKALHYMLKAIEIYDQKRCSHTLVNYYQRIFAEMHLVRIYGKLKDKTKQWEHTKKHLSMLPRSPSGIKALLSYFKREKKDKKVICEIAKRLVKMEPYGRKKKMMKNLCR